MTLDQMRAEVVRLGPWHHDIEIVPNVRTGELSRSQVYPTSTGPVTIIDPEEAMTHLVRAFYPNGFAGRSLLDCACNAGGWLFAARGLGAGRCVGFDIREHWIEQARFVAAHRANTTIRFAQCGLSELPQFALGSFDITLFNGIFYHLPDPVAGLKIAADHTHELLVVNTMISKEASDALVLRPESATDVMSGVHGLSWIPGVANASCARSSRGAASRIRASGLGVPVRRMKIGWRSSPHAKRGYSLTLTALNASSPLCERGGHYSDVNRKQPLRPNITVKLPRPGFGPATEPDCPGRRSHPMTLLVDSHWLRLIGLNTLSA
ncbi:MAG: class I SAM-dependent methyltransferase [Thermoanaerobaculia bacterium]